MKKLLLQGAGLLFVNIVGFFALKNYNDLRQVRLVNSLSSSVVEVGAVGPIIVKQPYMNVTNGSIKFGIKVKRLGFEKVNLGSGVFVSSDGLILTCNHMTHNSPLFEVSLDSFTVQKLPLSRYKTTGKRLAYVVGRDETADIALLKVISPHKVFSPLN